MNKLDGVPGAQNRSGVSGLLVSDPDDLRGQAESCRQLAVRALKPEHSASWMRLADEWDLLARAAENRSPPSRSRRGPLTAAIDPESGPDPPWGVGGTLDRGRAPWGEQKSMW